MNQHVPGRRSRRHTLRISSLTFTAGGTPYSGAVEAYRRLNDWLDSLPAWRLALTVGIPVFVVLLLAGGAIDWAKKGHINLSFLLPWIAAYTLIITVPYTLGQWRRQKRRAARSEAARQSDG